MNRLRRRLKVGGLVAGGVMCITACVPPLSLLWLGQTRHQRDQVETRLALLDRVEGLLIGAETGQRGFVITGKEDFLAPYSDATRQLPLAFDELARTFDGDGESRIVAGIIANGRHKLAELAMTVAKRRDEGFAAVEPVVSAGTGKRFMDDVRRDVATLSASERRQEVVLDESLSAKIFWAIVASLASTLFAVVVLAWLAREVVRSMVAREEAARLAQDTSAQLEIGMGALQSRNLEISALSEMSRVLQTEMSLAEALEVTGLFANRLLPGTSGAVYLFRNSADLLEIASGWGAEGKLAAPTMEPQACWGLRRGHAHECRAAGDMRCRHYAGHPEGAWHLCLPLMAYGEVLGQMHVWTSVAQAHDAERTRSMAQTVAEQVGLSLSNARLRQVLRDQSIKDGLTGMFNRRYMEETLARELARAQRNRQGLALVVADLDHFKRINDTYGHPVGDTVLKGVSLQMQKALRASDVACRYGGEEFLLILVDCSKQAAVAKAADLCARLAQQRFTLKEGSGPLQVTASFGVAAFPEDGADQESLMQAADAALYKAKTGGRNRVVAAGWALEAVTASAD